MKQLTKWLAVGITVFALGCAEPEQELGSATEHFIAAQDALAAGDQAKAIDELNKSIDASPDPWAYYQRARIYVDQGDDAKAMADCAAGLAIDSNHLELKWLKGELEKPKDRRFLGNNKEPPVLK